MPEKQVDDWPFTPQYRNIGDVPTQGLVAGVAGEGGGLWSHVAGYLSP